MNNGVVMLKITKEMWLEIEQGRKNAEIRKLNKDFAQVGDTIVFVDMDTFEVLGEKLIIGKLYMTPFQAYTSSGIKHNDTLTFIRQNYWEEPMLIVFTLGDR